MSTHSPKGQYFPIFVAIALTLLLMSACSSYHILNPKKEFEPVVETIMEDTANFALFERRFSDGSRKPWKMKYNVVRDNSREWVFVYIWLVDPKPTPEMPGYNLIGTVIVRQLRPATGTAGFSETYLLYADKDPDVIRLKLPGRYRVEKLEVSDIKVLEVIPVLGLGGRQEVYVFEESVYDYETKDRQYLRRYWEPHFGMIYMEESSTGTFSRLTSLYTPALDPTIQSLLEALQYQLRN